jgi:ABC-type polar amino acid transport system ATPase subunit
VAAYGSREVLHGIDLLVPWRRCVALVGESGSGKTTLARCVVGLHSNCAGHCRSLNRRQRHGRSIQADLRRASEFGCVFQDLRVSNF